MDYRFKFPATPGMPLFALSPGRVNVVSQSPSGRDLGCSPNGTPSKVFGHPEYGIPGDFGSQNFMLGEDVNASTESAFAILSDPDSKPPSIHGSPEKHVRTSSEVQAMVSRFNSLDIKDHAELRRKDVAALKRAQMGREEAEAEVKRLRSDIQTAKVQIEEGQERERKVATRLEDVMDELHRSKETQANTQSLYEKEIRKAKKEAFKSSSTVVKLQEELKAARNVLRSVQSDLDLERIKVERREKDTFNAQYELVGVKEEMARSMARIKMLEEEREALDIRFNEEQTARFAAEEKAAFSEHNSIVQHTVFEAEPSRKPSEVVEEHLITNIEEIEQLRNDLTTQKNALVDAEDLIEFMKMECQLGCCSCRVAESRGRSFVHDGTYDLEVQQIKAAVTGMLTPPGSMKSDIDASGIRQSEEATMAHAATDQDHPHGTLRSSESISDTEGVLHGIPPAESHEDMQMTDTTMPGGEPMDALSSQLVGENTTRSDDIQAATEESLPETPGAPSSRTITTTTSIPLVDHSNTDYSIFSTPTGLTREQAIEQLRLRRGRARSVAGTPRKGTEEPVTPRRDISAPQMKGETKTPSSSWRGRNR